MQLYIRDFSVKYLMIHSIQEFREFEANYIGGHIIIGDVYYFSGALRQALLKFLEENRDVDCYSSYDITDPILLSRFVKYNKVQLKKSAVEIGEVVNYYTVYNGTSYSPDSMLRYVEAANTYTVPGLLNLVKALNDALQNH